MDHFENNITGDIFLSDDEVVALYFKRDERAIVETDRKYRNYLISIAYRIINDMMDCEECLNDTYLSIWNSVPPKKPSPLKAYAAMIMRRKAMDVYRKNNSARRIPVVLVGSLSDFENYLSDEGYEAEYSKNELAELISEFVRNLPERRRYVFVKRYYMGEQIEEIASNLGCSRSTINKDIAIIKRDLMEKLGEEGFII